MDERRARIHDDLRGLLDGDLLFEPLERAPYAHDARLGDRALGEVRELASQMPAEVDDQTRPERPAGRSGPGPSGVDGDGILGRITDDRHHVVVRCGDDHAEGIDLVEAGVMRIGRALQGLEQHLAFEEPTQVVMNPGTAFIHGSVATSMTSPLNLVSRRLVPGQGGGAGSADPFCARNCSILMRSWRYRSPVERSNGRNRPSGRAPAPRYWPRHR